MENKKLLELITKYLRECQENNESEIDFKTWCNGKIKTTDEEILLDDIYEEVTYIADRLFNY